jgi:hypothetical protein
MEMRRTGKSFHNADSRPTGRRLPMAEPKTRRTTASVAEYLASCKDEQQAADCKRLVALCKRLTGQPPKMWGPSIVGFGSYRYTYASGRSGEMPLAAFAVRGRDLVVYLSCDETPDAALLAKLGKHKMGKACLYFRRLADLDHDVLERLVVESMADAKRRYGSES